MKAKLNSYLVGGGDLPMKFVRATSPEEARKVWEAKTGLGKVQGKVQGKDQQKAPAPAPSVVQVKPGKVKATRPPKEKAGGGEA